MKSLSIRNSLLIMMFIVSLAFSFLIGFLPRAFGQEFAPKINQGDMMVGGSIGLGYSTYSRFSFELNPTVEYFVVDRLAIGGTIGAGFGDSYESYVIGPSASYYFWNAERWTSSVGAEIRFGQFRYDAGGVREIENSTTGRLRLGLNYFLTPGVSLGPVLTLEKGFNRERSSPAVDYSTLKIQFQIHL